MANGGLCDVCGNELDAMLSRCPYCGQARKPVREKKPLEEYRVVNLEKGMPLVQDALHRLDMEEKAARLSSCRALVLIHGYGSSGKGGAIREAVRERLRAWLAGNVIRAMLPGEDCGKKSAQARAFGKQFPSLKRFVQRPNPGLTLLLL